MFFCLVIYVVLIAKVDSLDVFEPSIITAGPTYGSYNFNVLEHLTALSPYFESNTYDISPDSPQGCTVDKVIYLVRHGSINVNDYDYLSVISPFLQHLKTSKTSNHVNFSRSFDLTFLSDWTSPIPDKSEQQEEITKYGLLEAFDLGVQFAYRYPHLIPNEMNNNASFKVWTSEANRTKQTAESLLSGLFGGQVPTDSIVTVSESKDRGANTLKPTETCSAFDDSVGSEQATIWLEKYTEPIITRLNSQQTGFSFSAIDILAMQELCGYETVIRGSSSFCRIFTPEEWLAFEYYFDIKYFYSCGYGNHLSTSLGMPWVLAASDLLNDTNGIDQQNLYISISHREMVLLVVTALGLYNNSIYMDDPNRSFMFPLDQINYQRIWKTSKFVTALSHLAIERINCESAEYNGKFVRILINSAPQPLPGCTNGPGASCPLTQYMNYIKHKDESYETFSNACKMNSQNTTNFFTLFSYKSDK